MGAALMKLSLASLLAALTLFGMPKGQRLELHAALGLVAARVAALEASLHRTAAPTVAPVEHGVTLDEPVRVQLGRKVVILPERCRDREGRYDVVIHFHGAPVTIEPEFARAQIPAVFVIENLGIGSGPYEKAFISDGSLARLLGEIDGVVQKHCPSKVGGRGRVALSAWSAGYGAIYRVLASTHDRELVDAVLLADGLHAGFLDKHHKKMNDLQMAPFTELARLAMKGDKLFAITHTGIVTAHYASTTETADYLVTQMGQSSEPVNEPGPRPHMQRTSRFDRAGFHVWGYSGRDTDAHCDHLYAIGETLYPILKQRWAKH
jgi:hypothetical protein